MTDFNDIVDSSDLTPEEEARLRRAHALLVQAGPPPDLPPALVAPPTQPAEAEIVQFPLLPKRRWALAAVAAATLALLTFIGGYFYGNSKSKPAAFSTARVVAMHGSGQADAVLKISSADSVGNWPMEMTVEHLPQQHARSAYYELWLTKNGKAVAPCGTFRVHGRKTTVRFTVPYDLKQYGGWIVTSQQHDDAPPGPTVLT
jgi:Anti-sigma-K factor rskA